MFTVVSERKIKDQRSKMKVRHQITRCDISAPKKLLPMFCITIRDEVNTVSQVPKSE